MGVERWTHIELANLGIDHHMYLNPAVRWEDFCYYVIRYGIIVDGTPVHWDLKQINSMSGDIRKNHIIKLQKELDSYDLHGRYTIFVQEPSTRAWWDKRGKYLADLLLNIQPVISDQSSAQQTITQQAAQRARPVSVSRAGRATAALNTALQAAAQQATAAAESARLAAVEAARLAAIEAAAQAEAERLARESARLAAEADLARRVADAAGQRVQRVTTQQQEIKTAIREVEQLLVQLVAEEPKTQDAIKVATDSITQKKEQRVALQEKMQQEEAQNMRQYPHYTPADIPGHTNAPDMAARAAVSHARTKLAAEIDIQQAEQEIAQIAKQRLAVLAEADRAVAVVVQQATQEAAQLSKKVAEAQEVAQIAATLVSRVAARITPAYQAQVQASAQLVAQQTEVQVVAQLDKTPADSALKSAVDSVTEVGVRLTAVQKKCQEAKQEPIRLAAEEVEAERAAEEAAQFSVKLHAKAVATGGAYYPFYQKIYVAIHSSLVYLRTLETFIQENLIKKAQNQHADNPVAVAQAALMLTKLADMKQKMRETHSAMYQSDTQGTPEFHQIGVAYRSATHLYNAALASAYQAAVQLNAEKVAQQAAEEVSQLTTKLAETQAVSARAVIVDIQQAFAKRIAEISVALTAARERAQEAAEEVTRVVAQEAEAQRVAESYVEAFLKNPSVTRQKQRKTAQEWDVILSTLRAEQYLGTLLNLLHEESHVEEERLIKEESLAEEKRKQEASAAMNAASASAQQTSNTQAANAPGAAQLSLKSVELLLKCCFDALTSDEFAIAFTDPAINSTTYLLLLDILATTCTRVPVEQNPHQIQKQKEQSLLCAQRFFSNPDNSKNSLARLAELFNPSANVSLPAVSDFKTLDTAFDLAKPALQTAKQALSCLGNKAREAKRKNKSFQEFFKTTSKAMDHGKLVSTAQDTEFAAGILNVGANAPHIDLAALPAAIRAKITALGASNAQDTVQQTMSI